MLVEVDWLRAVFGLELDSTRVAKTLTEMNGSSSSEHRKKPIGDPLRMIEVGNGHCPWICSIGSTMPVSRTNFAMTFTGLLLSGINSYND